MKILRNSLLGILASLILIALPTLAFAQDGGNYSGDDAYDPAAGGLYFEPSVHYVQNFSGDDDYDPAAGGQPTTAPARYVNRFSGDDSYERAVLAQQPWSTRVISSVSMPKSPASQMLAAAAVTVERPLVVRKGAFEGHRTSGVGAWQTSAEPTLARSMFYVSGR